MPRTLTEQEFNAIKARVLADAPDGLSEDEFYRWAVPRFEGAIAEAENMPTAPEGSTVGRFVSNVAQQVNPLNIAKGIYQTVRHPVDTAMTLAGAQKEQFDKGVQSARDGQYVEAAGRFGAAALPVMGPAAARAADQMVSGDVAGGLGSAAGLVAPVVATRPLVNAGARAVGKTATPMARSALKPALTDVRQSMGSAPLSARGLNARANQLAQYIVDKGIASVDDAEQLVKGAEAELQAAIARAGNPGTAAPQLASKYLGILSRRAQRQGLPADDVAIVRAKMAELLDDSSLSETVMTTRMQPSPTGLVTASGQPVMVPTQVPTRQLRGSVPADEALELARGSGRFGNKKAWGEQKGMARESSKYVERATRDAVKQAVPGSREALQRQGAALTAKKVLDRMEWREGNREPISPFDVTTAAVETASGRPPVMAVARAFLRSNKLKMGIWAKRLEKAVATNDAATAALILDRFGVERAAATSPTESRMRPEPATAYP